MQAPRPYHILVVDDEPVNRKMLATRLARRGYEVSTAGSAAEAMTILTGNRPDLVLLDIFMPVVSGIEVLRSIRQSPATASLPVIMVSALGDTEHIVRGLNEGANDYVTKPVNQPILFARVEAQLRGSAQVRVLEVQTEILSRLAAYDELTSVYNRRTLFQILETELERCRRYGREVGVLLLDIDHFKKVNDTYGHPAGDAVLRVFAHRVVGCLRTSDILCRYGGEEFCAILPETNAQGALRAAERVRKGVASAPMDIGDAKIEITTSVGVSAWTGTRTGDAPDLLHGADRALYAAKHAGRNRVMLYDGSEVVALPS